MAISSSALIHFTKQKSSLKGILQRGFHIFYCLENLNLDNRGKSRHYEAAYPMVSFCDLPLSEVKNHIDKYGSYGIGLKKDWAIKNRLNPVLYFEKSSAV